MRRFSFLDEGIDRLDVVREHISEGSKRVIVAFVDAGV